MHISYLLKRMVWKSKVFLIVKRICCEKTIAIVIGRYMYFKSKLKKLNNYHQLSNLIMMPDFLS